MRQHELIDIAERLNEQFTEELAGDRRQHGSDATDRKVAEKKMIELRQALACRVEEMQEQ